MPAFLERYRFPLALGLAVLLGLAWMVGYAGPILAVLLIPLVLVQKTAFRRYAVAVAYYLAGSHGIPLASAVFFGPGGHYMEGIALWVTSSDLLAAGWSFADKPWKAALALIFDAIVPPLSFFDWMSPLSASGVFFPGTAILGVLLLLIIVAGFPVFLRKNPNSLAYFALFAVACNVFSPVFLNSKAPADWVGLNTHMGPSTQSIMKNYQRMTEWTAQAARQKGRVILLPETMLTWWQGNADYVQTQVPKGHTWLVGASIPLKKYWFADGIEEVRQGYKPKMIFASLLPVPVSMWRPWETPTGDAFGQMNYKAFWWQKPVEIDGKSTWAEICYDQLLPFTWLEASIYQPQVILATNNVWWARNTGIPQVQRASVWAWSRLTGSAVLEAENG